MAERETKEITTPAGHKVVLRTYLTGREENELKAVLFADLKVSMQELESIKETRQMPDRDVPLAFIVKQEEKSIEMLVVSFDGVAEGAAKAVLDLPAADYQAVVEEINLVRNPTAPGSSAQPGSGTSTPAQ